MSISVLDSREEIAKIDLGNVLGSVEALPDQCLDAWDKSQNISVPDSYKRIDNVLMCGMGGSGLGARVIESVYSQELKVPLVRVNGYDLPGFTNERTLVFCSSYSGSTEETIENVNQAIKKRSKWVAIGTGGKLLDLAKQHNVPFYQIEPTFNPSNQPRMAIGYSVVGQLSLASMLGIIAVKREQIQEAVSAMKIIQKENRAKLLAQEMKGKIIAYIAAEHLVGAMHTANNQLNENAKNFSADFQIPELNHHLMEGLKHPVTNHENLLVVFVDSKLYSDRIRKRFINTKEVVKKNGIKTFSITLSASSKLAQAFELIQDCAYANLYLSVLYGQNPAPIPWVDWFKEQMGK